MQGDHQDSVDADFCQYTREQGGCGRRRYRVRLGQPYMQGKHTRLGAKSQKDTDARRKDHSPVLACVRRGPKIREGQGPRLVIKKGKTHKEHQTADHCDEQIGITGTHSILCLFMDDPGEGCKGQDLKENESCHQVSGQHNALRGSQGHKDEHPVALQAFFFMVKIFRSEKRGAGPHQGCDHCVSGLESVHFKGEAGDKKSVILPESPAAVDECEHYGEHKFQDRQNDHETIAGFPIVPAQNICNQCPDHGTENQP